jgi:tRNA A37 threonylcarbamoyladenosine synthetase subunit TsaC/SUA5/YrdC
MLQGRWENLPAMEPILDIADLAQRREAAEATAEGAALFYAFGNFCALAARPELASLQAMNRLKGRPLDQVGSVTTTPEREKLVFDWDAVQLPWSALVATMADLHALGPIGFRGPAAAHIPDHLTVTDRGVRTVQLITPGDVCPSNALVSDVLDLIGEDILYITSANTSSHVSKQTEAAHYEMREIQREFGHRDDVVLIGHRNERAIRRRYPHHLPCSTSIVAFHKGELVLERLGSLGADMIEKVAGRHGLTLAIGEGASERVPVRGPGRPALPRRRTRTPRRVLA